MKYLLIVLKVVLILSGMICPVCAGPATVVVPFVALKQEYSDNIMFSEIQEADFITTLSGGMGLTYRTERIHAGLKGQLDQSLYRDYDELNALDKAASGSFSYLATERLSFSGSVRYANDSRRDRDAETTGLLLSGERDSADVSLSSGYQFTQTVRGELTADYGQVDIKDDDQTEDDQIFSLGVRFSKNLSEMFKNTTGLLNLNYSRYTADEETVTTGALLTATVGQENQSDVFEVSTGFSKQVTALLSGYCLGGAALTRTEEHVNMRQTLTDTGTSVSQIMVPGESSSSIGGVLSAGLDYKGLYYDMGVSVSHDMRGASGTGGVVQRTRLSGNIRGRLTDTFTLTFDASCYLNRNDRDSQADTDDLTINIQPGFRYTLGQGLVLSGVFRYTSVDDREDDMQREQKMISLLLKKEFE